MPGRATERFGARVRRTSARAMGARSRVRVSRGELSEAGRALVFAVERAPVPADVESGDDAARAARACPVCAAPMSEVAVPNTTVKVDVCAAHGTFFDRLELASAYQAIEIKNAVDDGDAEAFGRELAEDRADAFMNHSVLGRLLGLLRT